jgi:hypothetical protein
MAQIIRSPQFQDAVRLFAIATANVICFAAMYLAIRALR